MSWLVCVQDKNASMPETGACVVREVTTGRVVMGSECSSGGADNCWVRLTQDAEAMLLE